MSTRSYIGIENPETKTINFIYCHHDGYVEYNGVCLHLHYSDREKAEQLVKLGDTSAIYSTVEETQTLVYDDGSNNRVTTNRASFLDLAKDSSEIEFVYLFTAENEWVFADTYNNCHFVNLAGFISQNEIETEDTYAFTNKQN